MADEKKYLRKILRETRLALTPVYVAAVSAAVQQRLMATEAYRQAATLVLYSAKDNEIRTDALLDHALAWGRRVLMPKVILGSSELKLIQLPNRAALVPGAFGLLEPSGTEIIPVASLGRALICVPGLAFSRAGQRLGRGSGYYDRILAQAERELITAGLAYSFQLLERLPESPNDRRLALIVTESALHVHGNLPDWGARFAGQGGNSGCW